jgi:putative addiction module component (TIGR02574 family)
MTARERVLEEALALPTEDRAFLAERLDQSLERERFASPAIAAAWTAEIDRRIEAYERGELRASDDRESVGRMRRFLAKHRARIAIF